MAFGVDREKFNNMVNYVRENVGVVLTAIVLPAGKMVENHDGQYIKPVKVRNNPDELEVMVQHYMSNYNSYPDEPVLEYDNEKKYLLIKPAAEV